MVKQICTGNKSTSWRVFLPFEEHELLKWPFSQWGRSILRNNNNVKSALHDRDINDDLYDLHIKFP